jgi:uncharacterized protein with HEPN domain
MARDPRALLADVLDAARSIERFRRDLDLDGFRADELARAAVERKLEIIGEALNRLSREEPGLAERIPDVARIVGFRNVLAHGYDVVDDEVVWDAITTDLPGLTARVAAMLDELDASGTISPG